MISSCSFHYIYRSIKCINLLKFRKTDFTAAEFSGLGRVHAVSFVTSFGVSNYVSMCNNNEVISTSDSAAMLTLTTDNMLPSVALGQILLFLYRGDFYIWNDVVITETCYVIATSDFYPPS